MTSYTNEQVLAQYHKLVSRGLPHTAAMLDSLLADRTRLQAEVEALRWLPLEPCPTEAPCHFNNAESQCWSYGYSSCLLTIEQYRQNIDSARAKKGDV